MFEKLEIVRMAQALAAHAGSRQGIIARNIANADTPGYRAQDLADFSTVYGERDGVTMRSTRAGHLTQAAMMAEAKPRFVDGAAAPNGNTVSLEGEMVKAAEVRQSHDMALSIYQTTSTILRTALGRGR